MLRKNWVGQRILRSGKDSLRGWIFEHWMNWVSKSSRYSRQRNVLDRGNSTEAVKGMKYGISEKQQENWCGLGKVKVGDETDI